MHPRWITLFAFALLALLLSCQTKGTGVDFQDGEDAVKRGDYATAAKQWRPLAEQGHVEAQVRLGFMYERGEGVPQDDGEAVHWYRLAAEQGHAGAQSNLGTMYEYGRGVPQDYEKAVRWYRQAAEQGSAMGQHNLGGMYARGTSHHLCKIQWYCTEVNCKRR